MIFKLHYFLVTAGANAFSILLGVFIETYTDASPSELGALLMVTPFLAMFGRPILCSMADRKQAHRKYLLLCLFVKILSYTPFIVIPFMGEQVYRRQARACWYLLAGLKVCGDLAAGGLASIADSLAINYANRIGTSFGVYRVWGTISWMLFGIIIGQVNEVWFLPKYVPAFMILIGSLALDALFIWLWPEEYFMMSIGEKTHTSSKTDDDHKEKEKEKENDNKGDGFKVKTPTTRKCLMPGPVVWAQAKAKLGRVFCCCSPAPPIDQYSHQDQQQQQQQRPQQEGISKMAQMRILAVLLRRDQRIVLYLMYFVLAGACQATMSFFFISLSKICQSPASSCDFSQLAGLLQFSMAALETVLFIYIKRIIEKIGRLNVAALAMLLSSAKFMFYGTVWPQVSPYYSLLSEGVTGVIYGINLTLMVEIGHLFASEVRYILPELLERQIITPEPDQLDRLKYSLAATMQALISSASEGVGTGCGSLIYGLLLERISYESLWFIIGLTCCACLLVLLLINTVDTMFGLKLGLDVKAAATVSSGEKSESSMATIEAGGSVA